MLTNDGSPLCSQVWGRLRLHQIRLRSPPGLPLSLGCPTRHYAGRQRHHRPHLRQLHPRALLPGVRPAWRRRQTHSGQPHLWGNSPLRTGFHFLLSGFLTAINCSNVKLAAKVTEIFSITKVLALLLIIIAGMVHLCLGNTANLSPENLMQVRQWRWRPCQ